MSVAMRTHVCNCIVPHTCTFVRSTPAGDGRSALMLPLGGDVRLPLDVLHLLGEGRHLQLATVSKEWRSLYKQHYPACKTAFTAVMATAPLLAWARDNGYQWMWGTSLLIAEGGHLAALRWAHANGCSWNEWTCRAAAKGGHLELLQWARAKGCPCKESTCAAAAAGGHLDVLQWLRATGCEWDDCTCDEAAEGGHLEVLQWAHDNGCDWSGDTCEAAACGGHLHVLQWLRANGCPWDADTRTYAAYKGHEHVLQWAIDNGCPSPKNTTQWRLMLAYHFAALQVEDHGIHRQLALCYERHRWCTPVAHARHSSSQLKIYLDRSATV
jgi:hypothetical protein